MSGSLLLKKATVKLKCSKNKLDFFIKAGKKKGQSPLNEEIALGEMKKQFRTVLRLLSLQESFDPIRVEPNINTNTMASTQRIMKRYSHGTL